VFSNGKVMDLVLKQRLENKMYTWFREINALIAVNPAVILEKNPTASPSQC